MCRCSHECISLTLVMGYADLKLHPRMHARHVIQAGCLALEEVVFIHSGEVSSAHHDRAALTGQLHDVCIKHQLTPAVKTMALMTTQSNIESMDVCPVPSGSCDDRSRNRPRTRSLCANRLWSKLQTFVNL